MSVTRILLIDDHVIFRAGLAVLLGMEIANVQVLQADSPDEALLGDWGVPDLLLLDSQGEPEGISLLRCKWPQVPVIVLASGSSPEIMGRARERGAAACVAKEKTADNIFAVIRQVLAQPHLAGVAPECFAKNSEAMPYLTPRQTEILDLMCRGLTNKAIGGRLGLSANTVRVHVQALLRLLQVSNRAEAAFAARCRGVIPNSPLGNAARFSPSQRQVGPESGRRASSAMVLR